MMRIPFFLVLALATFGCGDGGDEPVAPLPRCTGEVTLEVGTSSSPTFTWEPACAVDAISVFQPLTTPIEAWRLVGNATIRPGVRYGTTPRATTNAVAPASLQPGIEAAVELIIIAGGEPQVIAGKQFTP